MNNENFIGYELSECAKAINELLIYYNNKTAYNTIRRIRYQVNVFSKWVVNNQIQIINQDILTKFLDYIGSSKKPTTYNLYVSLINKIIEFMDNNNVLNRYALTLLERDFNRDDILTFDEYKRLLLTAKEWNYEVVMYIMQFLYLTGLRAGELKFVTIENFNIGEMEINFKGGKRKIIFSNLLKTKMKKYIEKYKPREVFFYQYKNWRKPFEQSLLLKQMKNIGFYAGIELRKCHPHALRHLFSTEYMRIEGNSIDDLSKILGHKTINTTALYIHGKSNKSIEDNLNNIRC